ncbi:MULTISPECIES: pyridoxal 5'-phosphate synthase glutaminase subunit PdxT [Clostridium]|uniref:pyridoxal 5'-phosphate synthase glutaminase subunit PdxT n=1 Tax=Clostridium TaxID=1485 RepID=UPI000825B3B3|nr:MULTISPECIES: pyridoxal 5'-phosphate synthase glutaminase subunit PdxT [Clostridium]PJI07762.1 pyridoxal 5'-phosphate synthase glutaminase subunit PdxT [Clostridium sp. CT7]
MKVGVLAFQGGVIEHVNHIKKLKQEVIMVKKASDLDEIDRLIIPGGESTTIGKFLIKTNMIEPLRKKINEGMPVWGTCAGMIILAKRIENSEVNYIGAIDITVRRNAYGSQIDSFTSEALIPEVSPQKIPLVFVRAPFIIYIGDKVKCLCRVQNNIVAARYRNVLVTAFHPELTDNLEFHRYFLEM